MTTFRTWARRLAWMTAGIAMLYAVSALAGVASSGPLDPPGPVGSTMKSLDDLPPSWHQVLAANDGADACNSSRFSCVLGAAAVLDRETGLVWERVPEPVAGTWRFANLDCARSTTGGRAGWRLPSRAELMSLVVPLPAGHPFTLSNTTFWAADDWIDRDTDAAFVTVGAATLSLTSKTFNRNYLCVRGGNPPSVSDPSERPPSWGTEFSYSINTGNCESNRFGCGTSENEIHDRMTGLMWERSPSATLTDWVGAVNACMTLSSSGGYGWRLPQAHELRSLGQSGGGVALGHPFVGISGTYWTATTALTGTTGAYVVDFADLNTANVDAKVSPTSKHWCVKAAGDGPDGL